MNHTLQSDEYNRRKENFEKGLAEIDEKYIDYFKPRPPIQFSQKHDCIVNHFMITNTESSPVLKITSEELPKYIIDDLNHVFHQNWD